MKLRNDVVKSLYYVTYTLYSVLLPQLPTLLRLLLSFTLQKFHKDLQKIITNTLHVLRTSEASNLFILLQWRRKNDAGLKTPAKLWLLSIKWHGATEDCIMTNKAVRTTKLKTHESPCYGQYIITHNITTTDIYNCHLQEQQQQQKLLLLLLLLLIIIIQMITIIMVTKNKNWLAIL